MLKRYLLALIFPAFLATIYSIALNQYPAFANEHWLWSLIYYTLLCGIFNLVYYLLRRSAEFTGLLLAGIVVRLLLSLVATLIYALQFETQFAGFSLHFIPHYILFTIFEIRYLSQLIKSQETHEK